jgi:undecaprenyl-diphosphatase
MNSRRAFQVAGGVALGALLAFGALSVLVVRSTSGLLSTDGPTHLWAAQHRPDLAVYLARAVTGTGTGAIPYVLAGLAGLIAGRSARGRLRAAAVCVACLGAGQALRFGVLTLIARPRPPVADWATHASGWSFPSGHTVTAAITAGVLMGAVLLRAPKGKRALAVLIGCWGVAVGLTRVYLGVHWLTDVVGGWLFAVAWLGLCACLLLRLTPVS